MTTTTLAQASEANLYGWYLGFGIGLLVVVVVAVLVGWILFLALKIGKYAPIIDESLQQAERNTRALSGLRTTINYAGVIVGGLSRGRARLGG